MESGVTNWDETINKIATRISNMGLEAPAIFFLEAHRPLTFFANQALIFLAPVLFPFFGAKTDSAAAFFEERGNIEKLIRRLEEKADEREASERTARALRRAMRHARRKS